MSIRPKVSVLNAVLLSTAVTSIVAIVAQFWATTTMQKSKRKYPPMISIGLLATLREVAGGRMHTFLVSQSKKHGGIFRLQGPTTVVVVANAKDARAVSKDPSNLKPSVVYEAARNLFSGGNVATFAGRPGDGWYHRRQALNLAFTPKSVKQMNAVAINKANQWLSQTIVKQVDAGLPFVDFNAGQEMVRVTIEVICKAALDYDVSHAEGENLLRAIKVAAEEFMLKSMLNPLRPFATPFLEKRRQAFQGAAQLRKFAAKTIQQYRDNPSPTPGTAIDLIMKNQNYLHDSERVSDIIAVLIGGHDTTGHTMAFVLLELAKNPAEQETLRERLSQEDGGGEYLNAVLNETMRLHPAATLTTIRQLGTDFISSQQGYFVPKGALVLVAQCAITRDAAVIHDPDRFSPSRWLQPNTENLKQALLPFSVGKRNCVGQSLAIAELRSVIPLLVGQLRFTVKDEGEITTQGTIRLDNCILKASRV